MDTQESTVRPPEWWTAEHTAAWIEEVWGSREEWGVAMQQWGNKITDNVPRASVACYRPLSNKELIEMRAKDSRPANACYYDGRPIRVYKPLTVKRTKKVA